MLDEMEELFRIEAEKYWLDEMSFYYSEDEYGEVWDAE